MHRLVWRAQARDDLGIIIAYIAERDPAAARRLRDLIERAISSLQRHPFMARPGRIPGTRELVAHPNYLVIHRLTDETIEIVAVVQAKRRYP